MGGGRKNSGFRTGRVALLRLHSYTENTRQLAVLAGGSAACSLRCAKLSLPMFHHSIPKMPHHSSISCPYQENSRYQCSQARIYGQHFSRGDFVAFRVSFLPLVANENGWYPSHYDPRLRPRLQIDTACLPTSQLIVRALPLSSNTCLNERLWDL
jgi:hypothetical protein